MFIRSKLYLALILSTSLIGLTVLVLVLMYSNIQSVANEQKISNEIIKNVFEINILTNDFILYRNDRAGEQWQTKYENFGMLLNSFERENGEESTLKEIIKQNYEKLKKDFDQLSQISLKNIENNVKTEALEQKLIEHFNRLELDQESIAEYGEILGSMEKYSLDASITKELEEIFVTTITIDSQDIVSQAFQLHNLLSDKLESLQLRIYYIGFLTFLLLFAVILLLLAIFYNNVVQPITHLNIGAKEISKGNYGYKLDINDRDNDEIDQLASTFNSMSQAIRYDQLKLKKQAIDVKNKQIELEEQKEAILNVLDDVEAEKSKSEILAKDLEKFKLAVQEVSDYIIITDKVDVILFANSAAEKMTGFSAKKMIGRKPHDMWGVNWDKKMISEMKRQTKQHKYFNGRIKSLRKNGVEFICDLYIAPIYDEKGQIVFYVRVGRDITKELEVDRAKTEFVSLASHQLRTPLTAVNWYSEMLLDKHGATKLNHNQKKYLNMIYHSNQRMTQLVNSLLNVSRIEMGTFAVEIEKVDLLRIADSVIDELTHSIKEKNIKFEKDFSKNIPKRLKLDEQLIRIIIQNLLSNAVKYTPQGGKISLVIKKIKKDIKITISDTGYGIPKEAQPMIFTKLYRADNIKVKDTNGTGLGLYLAKSILDHVGGKIWFESVEDKGTTFHVSLPVNGMKSAQKGKKLETNIM